MSREESMQTTHVMAARMNPAMLLLAGMVLGAACISALAGEADGSGSATVSGAASAATSATRPHGDTPPQWQFFDKYCNECHNSTDWAGGLAFDVLSPDSLGQDAEVWEEAVRKLRGRLMPPPDKPQPDQQTINAQVAWLESRLDAAAAAHPNPGNVMLHRLNRTEYAREIERLLGLKIDAAALLPRDTKAEGFDTVASVLRVSPSFLDQYIVAAQEVGRKAVGNPKPALASVVYRTPPGANQFAHVEGLPLGTRGGLLVEHLFPADGEYVFNINQSAGFGGGYVTGLNTRQRLIMTIDGEKVFEAELGGEEDLKAVDQHQAPAANAILERLRNIKVPVKAGPRRIGIAFVARTFAESDEMLQPLNAASPELPSVLGVEIVGPTMATGLTETPSRRKIFICRPANEAEELPCATRIVSTLAREAFRRPVTDEDIAAPMRFYEAGRRTGSFDDGIQQAVMAIIASPKFLYRVETPPQQAQPGSIYPISDIELASRLSFFLWSQGPDEQLLKLATEGKLRDRAVVAQQVKRMLADPRLSALTTGFASQWLTVEELDAIEPDPVLYPEFDTTLREAFRREMELFVGSIFAEDQNVMRLLSADYTFLNERLALHYGIPNVRGDRFRRVTLPDSRRWGLLGKGSFLMGMSYANRTSPVRRGSWVLETLIGTPPAAPPPGVEALKENMTGARPQTVRERMDAHRANPTCNSCHGIIDPLGFALENFDVLGAWRDKDRETGTPIDADSSLHDIPLKGVDGLREYLLSRPDQFVQTITQKLMTYALGRPVESHDMPAVRAIVREAANHDYRFSAIVTGIVLSDAFSKQMMPTPEVDVKTARAALD
jgi:hypothetical protein